MKPKVAEAMSLKPAPVLREGGWCFSSLPLFTKDDFRRIYPDDLQAVRQKYPRGWYVLCFQYAGQQDGYHVLKDGELQVRVRGAILQPIPAPRFRWGDRVFAHPKQAIGVVRHIVWHRKRSQVCYSLVFGERPSGRWYFECDLEQG